MKPRPRYETRAQRARREFWKRLGVWVLIVFFALSASIGLIFAGVSMASRP